MTFCKKYDYLCKHPYKQTVIHTDHKPLTHFLSSDLHEGIYGHWADSLRRLNLTIQYIPGHRNKVADGLSRTLFDDPECSGDSKTLRIHEELAKQGPKWVWKDGAGGFDSFLKSLAESHKEEVLEYGTMDGIPVFCLNAMPQGQSWKEAYSKSSWFGEIYRFLHDDYATSAPGPILVRRAFDYRIAGDILWKHSRESYLPCIPESKVLPVLKEAHDESGHWAKTGTMARLRSQCYWPDQSQDVERYIAGCLACAQHGPATRSQPLHPAMVTYPFQLMGMDFIGPLDTTSAGNKFILNLGCYMSRFSVPFACKSSNIEDVLWCLKLFFAMYRKPYAFYIDRGHHFDCDELREFLRREGVAVDYSPSASHKSTGVIEVMNRILEAVVRKSGKEWDSSLANAGSAVNSRIIGHLGVSPKGIVLGPLPETSCITATLKAFPGRDLHTWVAQLQDPSSHRSEVQTYLRHRAEVHDAIKALDRRQKESVAARYNRGVNRVVHRLEDLVMLYQENSGKLKPRWRGPFRISGYGGAHATSFTLQQLNGRRIRGAFHGDHLKKFVPRTGYLLDSTSAPPSLPQQQTIRTSRRQE